MKYYVKFKILVIVIVLFLCSINYASNISNRFRTEAEYEEYYSVAEVSENVNDGVKVSIVKTDKYDNFQDEFVAVKVEVENINRHADLEVNITALPYADFSIINDRQQGSIVTANGSEEYLFEYKYAKSSKRNLIVNDIYNKNYATASLTDRVENKYAPSYHNSLLQKLENSKFGTETFAVYVLVVFLVLIVLIVAVYFINRYIKSHEDFFNIFLVSSVCISIIISTLLSCDPVLAYNQQTFLYGIKYEHIYSCEVWNGGTPHNFKFKIIYKFIGDAPKFDESLDSDGDKLIDNLEVFFLTDINNHDTDGDLINDFDEIYVIDTDPLREDTNNNGISDADEDCDGDGLSNLEESTIGTFMDYEDTDGDGLNDCEEVKKYHTDPLNADTDNDGVDDYEEVQIATRLEIQDIFSVDKDTVFYQELPRDNYDTKIYKNNVIQVELSGEVYGLIERHVKVKDKNNAILEKNKSILGRIIYIDSDYEDLDLDISFDISNYSLKSDSLQICTLDNGRIVMLDTYIEDNKISATIKKGYVFVMDIVRYVDTILGYKKDNYK